jgi:hypothetical protein
MVEPRHHDGVRQLVVLPLQLLTGSALLRVRTAYAPEVFTQSLYIAFSRTLAEPRRKVDAGYAG